MLMYVLALVSWWYGSGWLDQASLVKRRFMAVADRYSLGLLLKTLFMPFKQLDAYAGSGGSLDSRFRAWLDRLISRCIGAMIRTTMIVIGTLVLVFEALIAVTRLTLWPAVPLLPALGVFLWLSGWLPWQ